MEKCVFVVVRKKVEYEKEYGMIIKANDFGRTSIGGSSGRSSQKNVMTRASYVCFFCIVVFFFRFLRFLTLSGRCCF